MNALVTYLLLISTSFGPTPDRPIHPFDRGMNENFAYFNAEDLEKWEIHEFKEVQVFWFPEQSQGEIYVDYYEWLPKGEVRRNWHHHIFSDSTLSIDSLESLATFVNGDYFLIEGEFIREYSQTGQGTLSHKEFERKDSVAVRYEYEKYTGRTNISTLHYSEAGLPLFTTCCSWTKPSTDSLSGPPEDTVFYRYDAEGMLTHRRKSSQSSWEKFPYLEGEVNGEMPFMTYQQVSLNGIPMEDFLKQKMGYAPKTVFFEIYRLGVFPFAFNFTTRQYISTEYLILE